MLLSLFTIVCFNCKEEKPKVTMKGNGTMVTVWQHCKKCGKDAFCWISQSLVFGRYPAGNFLLSFAVLMAGVSISKVLLVFRHMGLCVYKVRTHFYHQNKFLFSVTLHYWRKSYISGIINKLKKMEDLVWCGDGRFDSMGHLAKYGVHTMFCGTIMEVVHFELVQVNKDKTLICMFSCPSDSLFI